MAEPRLKAGLWVKMALRMADRDGRAGVVLRKGDADSGGVLVVLRGRDGLVVLSQVRAADGALAWMRGPAQRRSIRRRRTPMSRGRSGSIRTSGCWSSTRPT